MVESKKSHTLTIDSKYKAQKLDKILFLKIRIIRIKALLHEISKYILLRKGFGIYTENYTVGKLKAYMYEMDIFSLMMKLGTTGYFIYVIL